MVELGKSDEKNKWINQTLTIDLAMIFHLYFKKIPSEWRGFFKVQHMMKQINKNNDLKKGGWVHKKERQKIKKGKDKDKYQRDGGRGYWLWL